MSRLSFRQWPFIAKLAAGVALYITWGLVTVFVIERYSLWKYMPYYRVRHFCVWDLTVGLIIGFGIWRLSRRRDSQSA